MTRIIQAESASIRETCPPEPWRRRIRAAVPDQIGGRLARKTLCFKPFQSNSNRFKPKNSENRFPSNPHLYGLQARPFRAIPSISDQFRPKKCENRHMLVGMFLTDHCLRITAYRFGVSHPDLTGAIRSYPDLKNVKTRLVLGPWSFFIGTFLELVEDPDPIGGTCGRSRSDRGSLSKIPIRSGELLLPNRYPRYPRYPRNPRRRSRSDRGSICSKIFGVIRCCLVLFGAVWC